jgi:ABC-type Na+ efflux pump permease subunit
MDTLKINHIKIIWAITVKDLLDVVKNKNVLGVIIPSLFVIVIYRFMPAITAEDGPPALLIYDAGNPGVMTLLEESPAVDLYTYESVEQMLYFLSNGEQPELGLVIPAGFDQAAQTEQPLVLKGYMLHFFSDDEVSDLQKYMQDELAYLLGKSVSIQIDQIQLQPDTHGITILASMGLSFVLLMVGMISLPHIMLEEKQNNTLAAILVSPANSSHVVTSKALTGLLFSLVVYGFGCFLFRFEIVQWPLAIIAGLLGALFAVSLGLLLGILVDTRQQLVLWAWVGLVPLFLPMMLSFMDDLLPESLIHVVKWVPSSALMRVIRSSMVYTPPVDYYLPQLIVILISAFLVMMLNIWLIRRSDR